VHGLSGQLEHAAAGALQRLNSESLVLTDEKYTVALRHRPDDVAGEAEDRGLVRGAVADYESPSTIGKPIEHPAQCSGQDGGVLVDQRRICRTQGVKVPAPDRLVSRPPTLLHPRPQAILDLDTSRHLLAQRGEEAGQSLGGSLGSSRDQQLVATVERGTDLKGAADAVRREGVVGVVGVPSKLHVLGHRSSSGTGVVAAPLLVYFDIDGRMILSPVELEFGLVEELELTARALMDIGHDQALCLSP
jgi:hypothetical protein